MPPTDAISMLSDRELSQRLKDLGVNVGPIVQTTRGLYEKKLRKMESGMVEQPRYEEVPDDDDDDEEEEEEEEEESDKEVQVNVRPTRNEPRRRVPTKVTPSRATRPPEPEVMTSRSQVKTRSAPPPVKKESKGFPLWTILFFILFLAAVGYLVVRNMEPDTGNNIPSEIEMEV